MKILITGALGYIGSHAVARLDECGHQLVLLDNLVNSKPDRIYALEKITRKKLHFIKCDLRDSKKICDILSEFSVDLVIHFAALKSVPESVIKPLNYYSNNVHGTICLLQAMKLSKVKKIIFSSSASVYGNPVYLPIDEMHRVEPSSPYGKTKLQIENMLHDLCLSDPDWKAICFRYFNPIGAHESGLIGEEPNGVPSNLLPFISRVAAGKCQALNIYGNNYSTRDGTGIRDYIHIMDLIDGHLAGLNYLDTTTGFNIFNLGVGKGISVLEIIDAFEKANGIKINYKYSSRRLGDIDACYANPTKSRVELNWIAKRSLESAIKSSWNFDLSLLKLENG